MQARAVVVVGLPFPNMNSPELQERMKYVSKLAKDNGEQKDAGRELYENLCMNAVNQSIGQSRFHFFAPRSGSIKPVKRHR